MFRVRSEHSRRVSTLQSFGYGAAMRCRGTAFSLTVDIKWLGEPSKEASNLAKAANFTQSAKISEADQRRSLIECISRSNL